MTKAGDFAGSNRLKHMTDAMCHIERSKESNQRLMYFSKNRDCDKDFDLYFTIQKDSIHYSYETIKED
jgi:predicted ATP-dependent serine protease